MQYCQVPMCSCAHAPAPCPAQVPDQEELDKASREAQEHRQALEQQQQAGSTTINQPDTSIESAKHVAVSVSGGLPFTPVTLVFKHLRYYVPNPAAAQAGKAGKAGKEGERLAGPVCVGVWYFSQCWCAGSCAHGYTERQAGGSTAARGPGWLLCCVLLHRAWLLRACRVFNEAAFVAAPARLQVLAS